MSEINTKSIMIHNEDVDLGEFDPNSVVILCLHIRPKHLKKNAQVIHQYHSLKA